MPAGKENRTARQGCVYGFCFRTTAAALPFSARRRLPRPRRSIRTDFTIRALCPVASVATSTAPVGKSPSASALRRWLLLSLCKASLALRPRSAAWMRSVASCKRSSSSSNTVPKDSRDSIVTSIASLTAYARCRLRRSPASKHHAISRGQSSASASHALVAVPPVHHVLVPLLSTASLPFMPTLLC